MQYPLISDYLQAVKFAADTLNELDYLEPVLDSYGEPYRSSGAFAVVFKMRDTRNGKLYALKCFTEDQPKRAEAYKLISDELQYVNSRYLTTAKYIENEILVTCSCPENEFPVLLMEWIEGETMEQYIAKKSKDSYAMSMLCYNFCEMAAWLRSQPFAHGDIKPDNIMVQADGQLTLVDYDGMFVPAMKDWKSPTLGTQDFSHPGRTVDDFNESIDDFALASIALSLKAISLDSSLLDQYGGGDRLLFSKNDYLDIANSASYKSLTGLMADKEMQMILSLFLHSLSSTNLSSVSFKSFRITLPEEEILSTEVTDEDLENAIEDEYGAKYSPDGRRLLWVPRELRHYTLKKGTKVICDIAFSFCKFLKSILIPNSVTIIGEEVFSDCASLESIIIPDTVTIIGESLFYSCVSLKSITMSNSATNIGFADFAFCSSLESIVIPDSVTNIDEYAFESCVSLKSITIPDSVMSIGGTAFIGCSLECIMNIQSSRFKFVNDFLIDIKENILIGYYGKGFSNIAIPNTVTSIGNSAFSRRESIESITIPNSLTSIGYEAFRECRSLKSIEVPDSVTDIGEGVFAYCKSLEYITISNSVKSIHRWAFLDCVSLKSILIPNSVTIIGQEAFAFCSSLESITIPDSVISIGAGAFHKCKSLESITIPDSVTNIGNRAFRGCVFLNQETKEELRRRYGYTDF